MAQHLERQLLDGNNRTRMGVRVIFRNSASSSRHWTGTTNKYGYFRIDNVDTAFPSGDYQLEYYGDGITRTKFDVDGTKIQEDTLSP